MKNAIERYKKAEKELEEASQHLADAAQPHYDRCGDDIPKIMELIEKLPSKWRGVRRMYEKIYKIEDKQTKPNA